MRTFWTVVLAGGLIAAGCARAPARPPAPEPPVTASPAAPLAPADRDGDGIADASDLCPGQPEDFDGFRDDDGCPDTDNDGDGIADARDRCPNSSETWNGVEEEDGCPDQGAVAADTVDPGQMEEGLLAAMAGEPKLDSKNQPTSIRAIKARPLGGGPAEPPPVEAAPRPRPVASGPAPVVAVFDVQDASKKLVDASTREQLTEYLSAQLTEQAGFRIVPRDQLRARLAEQKTASYQQCFDQSCQLELGKAMAAEKSLSTKLLQVGRKCAITATLYDLRSETTEKATTVDTASCKPEDLLKGLRDVAARLAGR